MPPPVKLAIIGGGPSAFYVASRLLSLLPLKDPMSPPLRVHMYDRLWAPHGLVRYGVAPDHPEVKVSFEFLHVSLITEETLRIAHTNSMRLQLTLVFVSSET
jgi:hypothetical protein